MKAAALTPSLLDQIDAYWRRDLRMPDFHDYAVDVPSPGAIGHEA